MPLFFDVSPAVLGVTSKAGALYQPVDSRVRLAAVRRVLEEEELDALLFIAGVDSGDCLGCTQAINYLLLGACGAELTTPLLLDQDFEETVLLIHKGGVRLYTTPQAGRKVIRICSSWPGVEIISLDKLYFKNQDLFEEHKMASFKAMLKDLKRIGVPYSAADPMAVESWPLVQSYALDVEGQRRFFTMAHDVKDVSAALDGVYRMVDSHTASSLVVVQLPMFSVHWRNTLEEMKGASEPSAGPLEVYFSYGAMRRAPVLKCWGVGEPAVTRHGTHVVVEACDPQAPLKAARSAFLTALPTSGALDAGFGPSSACMKGVAPPSPVPDQVVADVPRLARLYADLSSAVSRFVRRGNIFGEGKKVDLQAWADAWGGEGPPPELKVVPMDMGPFVGDRVGTRPSLPPLLSVTYVRAEAEAGVLVYGDTFAQAGDGLPPLNLTRSIDAHPTVAGLPYDMEYAAAFTAVIENLKSRPEPDIPLGEYYGSFREADGCHFYAPVAPDAAPELRGEQHLFANGAVFTDQLGGPLDPLLLGGEGVRVEVFNPLELDRAAVAVFYLPASFRLWPSLEVQQQHRVLVLCFRPGSVAKRAFVFSVLPAWKKACPTLSCVDSVPEVASQHRFFERYTAPEQPKPERGAREHKPFAPKPHPASDAPATVRAELLAAYPRWGPALASPRRLSALDAPTVFPPCSSSAPENAIKLDLLVGWFGIGKHKFAVHLSNVVETLNAAKRRSGGVPEKIVTVSNTEKEGVNFDPLLFYKQLRAAVGSGAGRIVYTAPGNTPVSVVVRHLALFPDRKIALHTCTALLHGDCIFADDDFRILPGLCDQLTNGFLTQCFVTPTAAGDVSEAQKFLTSVNDTCEIVYQADDAVQGILAPTASLSDPKFVEARKLSAVDVLEYRKTVQKLSLQVVKFKRLITTKHRLLEYVSKVADAHSGLEATAGVLRMKALVHCDGEHLQVTVGKGKPFLTRTKLLRREGTYRHDQEFLFVGLDLDVDALRQELEFNLICKESLLNSDQGIVHDEKRQHRLKITVDSLQPQDIEDISASLHCRSLPYGWYFDGSCYVNPYEEKSTTIRPDIDELLQEHVANYNAAVDKYNKTIDEDEK